MRETTGAMLALDDVSVAYQTHSGPLVAIQPCTFTVEAGEFVSLVGPSGCGKSTLLKAIAGLLKPSSGGVSLNGEAIDGPPDSLGVVFQEPLLLDWRDALGNVLLQVDVRRLDRKTLRPHAERLLERVGLGALIDKRPYELSGGMRQRVAVCRALVHQPSLLLMDEPFGALDALTREQMNEDLQRLWLELGMTVFFVTHSIPEAVLLSDRVLVMSSRPGEIVANVAVDLPRPRDVRALQRMPEYADYVEQLRTALDQASGHASAGAVATSE